MSLKLDFLISYQWIPRETRLQNYYKECYIYKKGDATAFTLRLRFINIFLINI